MPSSYFLPPFPESRPLALYQCVGECFEKNLTDLPIIVWQPWHPFLVVEQCICVMPFWHNWSLLRRRHQFMARREVHATNRELHDDYTLNTPRRFG